MPTDRRGFTLIEALVALAIAGLVLGALYDGTVTGLRIAADAGHTAEALSHARSRIAALGIGVKLVPGVTEGDDGGGMRWRHTVTRQQSLPGGIALFEVRVDIAWTERGRPRTIGLTTRCLGSGEGGIR